MISDSSVDVRVTETDAIAFGSSVIACDAIRFDNIPSPLNLLESAQLKQNATESIKFDLPEPFGPTTQMSDSLASDGKGLIS
jgi:hypothetical protein